MSLPARDFVLIMNLFLLFSPSRQQQWPRAANLLSLRSLLSSKKALTWPPVIKQVKTTLCYDIVYKRSIIAVEQMTLSTLV